MPPTSHTPPPKIPLTTATSGEYDILMPEPPIRAGPILDYSSPRPHGRVRLPSQSRIEILPDADGVIVHEWLAARQGAIIALAFAGCAFVLLIQAFVSSELERSRGRLVMDLGAIAFFGVLVLLVLIGGIVVMAMVINNTWRHTFLEVRRDSLILRFRAPFGSERFEWNVSEVEEVRLETTTQPTDRNHLAEIELHIAARPVVKLFTDHTLGDLQPIAAALQRGIKSGC